MLQCGCQLVSLNTQSVDVYYVVIQGIFEKNRNCGYALKNDVKKQDHHCYTYRMMFMDCLDLRPRKKQHSGGKTTLQVSFVGIFIVIVGTQEDMKRNYEYVNYQNSAGEI